MAHFFLNHQKYPVTRMTNYQLNSLANLQIYNPICILFKANNFSYFCIECSNFIPKPIKFFLSLTHLMLHTHTFSTNTTTIEKNKIG